MAKKNQNKPETTNDENIQPLKVEIEFPSILDLKQALAFDADGNLLIKVQFTSRVDQFEIFRLVNLLKQPHGALYAKIGTPQAAMDFQFDDKNRIGVAIEAAKALPQGNEYGGPRAEDIVSPDAEVQEVPAEPKKKRQTKAEKERAAHLSHCNQGEYIGVCKFGEADCPALANETTQEEPTVVVKIQGFTNNHMEEEEKPFGVCIDYVNGTGEIKTCAGRGMNPTEAVIAGVIQCGLVPADRTEPFEFIAALEQMESSEAGDKLIAVLGSGSFEEATEPAKGD